MTDLAVGAARRQFSTGQALVKREQTTVDVGIVYSGEQRWLDRLLASLERANDNVDLQIQLVCTRAVPRIDHPLLKLKIHLLHNRKRLGFADNFNRVLLASRAEYVVVMNTDMYFSPDSRCISQLIERMEQHPRCGVAGCRVYRPDGSYAFPARRNPTWQMVASRRLPFFPDKDQHLTRYLYADRSPQSSFECDWHSGCFISVRRAAYRAVGGFDNRFRKYFEDVEFCQRMRDNDWRVMHFGEPLVWHDEQRASRDWLSRNAWLHLRAYWLWLRMERSSLGGRSSREGEAPAEPYRGRSSC